MAVTLKKTITPLVLLSFLVMALFSFSGMSYGPDGSMRGDCPFSSLGTSLCPPSALPGAVHHISAYQSFINVPINSGITTLIISLLITVSVAITFSFHQLLRRDPVRVPYHSPPFTSQDRKIKRWLSLFENSPSN
ncbi:MAG: hypothetical protein AAB517_00295 [Patescibacteria group bacterium]